MNHDIEALILREARLLDERRYDDWLALYSPDATYWVPIDENADPLKESSIIYDNHQRLAMRVEQLARQRRVAQAPASQTLRMVTNIEVQETGPRTASARFALLLTELRSGDWRQRGLGEMRSYPGHCEMHCRRGDAGWEITHKKIVLLNRRQPIIGLSFIL